MAWKVRQDKKIHSKNTILIEGLPGIGNVGKIAVDFMIDELNAEKVASFQGGKLPHIVFVNENNMVELPKIEVYQKKLKDKTLLFVSGDIQPIDENSCYEFCNSVLDICKVSKCKEIITLGGVGLINIPENPKVYCAGNDKKVIKKYLDKNMNTLNDLVGPITGVSGVLVGLAKKRNIPAITLLAETYGNPAYMSINGANELLKVISKRLNLKINTNKLKEDISKLEQPKPQLNLPTINMDGQNDTPSDNDLNYIG